MRAIATAIDLNTLAARLREVTRAAEGLQFCEDVLFKFDDPEFARSLPYDHITHEGAVSQHREAARRLLIAVHELP